MLTHKSWDKPAFGSQSIRFHLNGLHPNLYATGKMPYEPRIVPKPSSLNLGPGQHDLLKYSEFSEVNVARRAEGPNIERGYLTEKLAKMPHLLYQEQYKKKQEDKRRLGPGYYDLCETDDKLKAKPHSERGMLAALAERFTDKHINNNPGPGDYGVPDALLEEKRKNKPGKVPVMERSKQPRSLPMVGCEVPPASYNHKNTIDELLKKKVSNRGPYDLFTESRSAPTHTGFFAEDLTKDLGPGQYDLPSFVDNLKDTAHAKHGKFGKIAQYPNYSGDRLSSEHTSLKPRNPSWPGPGAYSPSEASKPISHMPPFLSSSQRTDKKSTKNFNGNFNPVGVARYDIQKIEESEFKNGHRSIFISKSSQITDKKNLSMQQERLKPKNLSQEEKSNIYKTGNINGEPGSHKERKMAL